MVTVALLDFDNDRLIPDSLGQILLDSLLGSGESLFLKSVVAAHCPALPARDHVIGLRILGDRELLATTFAALEAECVLSHLTPLGVQFLDTKGYSDALGLPATPYLDLMK